MRLMDQMRLIILGVLILALISTASAYNINAQGMGIIKSVGDANGNTATGHVYMTNGLFDPDDTGLYVNPGYATFDLGGSFSTLGEFGVEVSAKNSQGDTASSDVALTGYTDDMGLGLSADATSGTPTAGQNSYINGLVGTATVHTGASSGGSNADVTTKVTQPDDIGMGYLSTIQEATTSQTQIQGALAAQSSIAQVSGSSSAPSIATVKAASGDAGGSTSTQATVNNGDIGDRGDSIPIYQLAASGTIADDATSTSINSLGLTDPNAAAVIRDYGYWNTGPISNCNFNLENYRGFSGSIAGGFYETSRVYSDTFDSIGEGSPLLSGDYAVVTASASNTDAGGSYLEGIEAYDGQLGAYGLAAQGTMDGTSDYYAEVPRNGWSYGE